MFSLIPYNQNDNFITNAFNDLENFSHSFWETPTTRTFKTDIKDMGNNYLLEADMPGVTKQDIEITVDDNYLTIKCNKSETHEDKDSKNKYLKRERFFGSFCRSFDIKAINADEITAKYQNGVLKLNLPKKSPENTKTKKQITID